MLKTSSLSKKKIKIFIKNKTKGINKLAGRNNSGKITANHRGGGHKRKYRQIDFYRTENSLGIVCAIEYDPNRSGNISAIYDFNKNCFFYILAPKELKIGDIVESGVDAEPKLGNSLPIEKIPVGSYIHNITLMNNKAATISRSAGAFSKLKDKISNFGVIELGSGQHRYVPFTCYATIGIVSNEFAFLEKSYKAGQSRWLNKRPKVRGVAMNPVDHPHGGGEGKKSGLNKTPWGKNNNQGRTSRSKIKATILNNNE